MIKLICPDCNSDKLDNIIDIEFGYIDVFICTECGKEIKFREACWIKE